MINRDRLRSGVPQSPTHHTSNAPPQSLPPRNDLDGDGAGPSRNTMTDLPQPRSPEPPSTAVVRESRPSTPAEDQVLELHEIQTREDNELDYASPSASSGEEYRVTTRRQTSRRSQPPDARPGLWRRMCRFWTHNVTLTVPQKSNRDHFALERTFLAYIRTSVVIAMQGVLIAQLFRLQRSRTSEDRLGFYQVGVPLSVTCHCVAVLVALIGAYRFWRQQSAISRGKVHAGGWELNSVGAFLFAIILVTLVISVAIIVEIDESAALIRRMVNLVDFRLK